MNIMFNKEVEIFGSILKRVNEKKDRVMIISLYALYEMNILIKSNDYNNIRNIGSVRNFLDEQFNNNLYILSDAKLVKLFKTLLFNSNFCTEQLTRMKQEFVFLAKLLMKTYLQNYQKFLLIEFIRNITTNSSFDEIELSINRFATRLEALKEQLEVTIQTMLTSSSGVRKSY